MSDIHGKKKALGRGLSALLDNPESERSHEISSDYPAGSVTHIPISQIEANPFQPRTHFNETELAELAMSIQQQGIIQPLTLRKLSHDKYQIIAGERRLKASIIAGLTEVPSYVRLANDEQMLEMALVENIQRSELNPLEIAISFQRLLEECNIKQEELSQKVGKDRSTISNYIRLLKLPAEIQLAVRDTLITMGHARAIINVDNEASQLLILQRILEQKLSVRQVEEMAREILTPKLVKQPVTHAPLPSRFEKAMENLAGHLNSPVEVKLNNKGRGSIIITFKSDEDFDRIVSKLES
jgi:ParB family chromosome partitioning protein